MRFLKLCFVLMVFGFSVQAQEKYTGLYRISLYKWEWGFYHEIDTIYRQHYEGNATTDTIIRDTPLHPIIFGLKYPIKKSFYSSHFEVTSVDQKIKYEVRGFDVSIIYSHLRDVEMHCVGSSFQEWTDDALHNCKADDQIFIGKIIIFDPALKKEISLSGITIYVK